MVDASTSNQLLSSMEAKFVVEVQLYLQDLITDTGISRAELARRMGVSRARITQIFSDDCTNLTIRLLARAAQAMGEEPRLNRVPICRLSEA